MIPVWPTFSRYKGPNWPISWQLSVARHQVPDNFYQLRSGWSSPIFTKSMPVIACWYSMFDGKNLSAGADACPTPVKSRSILDRLTILGSKNLRIAAKFNGTATGTNAKKSMMKRTALICLQYTGNPKSRTTFVPLVATRITLRTIVPGIPGYEDRYGSDDHWLFQ